MARMTVDETRRTMDRYLGPGDNREVLSEDVVYEWMHSGERFRTPQGVLAMLHRLYTETFEGRGELVNLVVGEGIAMMEGVVAGRHIGEFLGVPATGRDVRMPLVVVYEMSDGRISNARVYMQTSVFLSQVADADVSNA